MNHVQIPLSLYKLTTPNESFIMLKKTASAEHEEKGNFKMLTVVPNSRDSNSIYQPEADRTKHKMTKKWVGIL